MERLAVQSLVFIVFLGQAWLAFATPGSTNLPPDDLKLGASPASGERATNRTNASTALKKATPASANTVNLIKNPGFEDLDEDGTYGDGWIGTGNTAFMNYYPQGNPGHATFFSDITGNSGSVYCPGIPVVNGATYRLKLDAAFEANWNASVQFGVQFLAGDDETVVSEKLVFIKAPNPEVTTYRTYSMSAKAPLGVDFIRPFISYTNSIRGAGNLQSAEFDNVVLFAQSGQKLSNPEAPDASANGPNDRLKK